MKTQRFGKTTAYFVLLSLVLVSCTPAAIVAPTSVVTPSVTLFPAKLILQTNTPTISPSITQAPTPVFDIPINKDNPNQIVPLTTWGNTSVSTAKLAAKGKTIVMQSPLGLFLLSAVDSEQITFIKNSINFAISNDGNLIASGQMDGTVNILDAASGKFINSFQTQKKEYDAIVPVRSLAFTHDNQKIAAGFSDGQVGIWWIYKDKDPLIFQGGDTAVHSLQFSPNDQYLFTLSFLIWLHEVNDDGIKTLWKENYIELAEQRWPYTASFSNDGKIIALNTIGAIGISGGGWLPSDCLLIMLQTENGEIIAKKQIEECKGATIGFSEDSQFLYVDLPEQKLRQIRRAGDGLSIGNEPKNDFLSTGETHFDLLLKGENFGPMLQGGYLPSIKGATSLPDSGYLIWGTTGNYIYWWNSITNIVVSYPQESENVIFSSTGSHAVYCSNNQVVIVRREGANIVPVPEYPVCEGIAVSPDGNVIAIWSGNRLSLVYPSTKKIQNLVGHQEKIKMAVFSNDGTLLASGPNGQVGDVTIWRINPVREILRIKTMNYLFALAFTPDNSKLAVQAGYPLKLYNISDTNNFIEFPLISNLITFSEDSSLLAAADQGTGRISLWSVPDGKKIRELPAHKVLYWKGEFPDTFSSLTFLPSDIGLVSSGYDGSIILWGIDPMTQVRGINANATKIALQKKVVSTYGPKSGTLDFLSGRWVYADIKVQNFIMEVTYSNLSDEPWSNVIDFRQTEGSDNAIFLTISSDGYWKIDLDSNGKWNLIAEGHLYNLGTNMGDSNKIQLVIINESAQLYVNDLFVDTIDISGNMQYGDVQLTINHEGQMGFEDFTIWELPSTIPKPTDIPTTPTKKPILTPTITLTPVPTVDISRAAFFTGWENGQPEGFGNLILDSKSVVGYDNSSNPPPEASPRSKERWATPKMAPNGGSSYLMVAGYSQKPDSYIYFKLFDTNIKIEKGMKLRYWIYTYQGKTFAIDGYFTDGTSIRDFNNNGYLTDQNGNRIHPAFQGVYDTGYWRYVEVDLSNAAGKTLDYLTVDFDNGDTGFVGPIRAYIDNLSIAP